MNRELHEAKSDIKGTILDGISARKRLCNLYEQAVAIYDNIKLDFGAKIQGELSQKITETIRRKANKL